MCNILCDVTNEETGPIAMAQYHQRTPVTVLVEQSGCYGRHKSVCGECRGHGGQMNVIPITVMPDPRGGVEGRRGVFLKGFWKGLRLGGDWVAKNF